MTDDNVKPLEQKPAQANPRLVEKLQTLLDLAKTGQLYDFVGTGTMHGGDTLDVCVLDDESDIYPLLGQLAALQVYFTQAYIYGDETYEL